MKKKYQLEGTMFRRHEIIRDGEGNEVKTEHIGMDDGGSGEFAKTLESIVPKLDATQKVRVTFELI